MNQICSKCGGALEKERFAHRKKFICLKCQKQKQHDNYIKQHKRNITRGRVGSLHIGSKVSV